MKPEYNNWMPKKLVVILGITLAVLCGLEITFGILGILLHGILRTVVAVILGILICVFAFIFFKFKKMYDAFDYAGDRKLSKQIVEGVAKYVEVSSGGKCLDVGCGSGALSIAVAKENPDSTVVGIDRWGKEYASFSKKLCESNAVAEGVNNTVFKKGDAVKLNFPDETFDAVTSNYVYHNVTGANKQELLLETLRVLKKGGTFALHDIMSKRRYGDMDEFILKLKDMGYREARLVPTDSGLFMSEREGKSYFLKGSAILVGKK